MKNSNLVVSHLTVQKIEQISAANSVVQDRAVFHLSPFSIHAVAVVRDAKTDQATTKSLEQRLGIGCIITQIGNDESLAIIAAVNHRECVSTRTSIEALRQLCELLHADQIRREWAPSADDSG